MKKYILLLALVYAGTLQSYAQSTEAMSPSISIDYSANEPTTIVFTSPKVLAETRGFKLVKKQQVDIEGVVLDSDGIGSLKINDMATEISEGGQFKSTMTLEVGMNKLLVQFIDGKNNLTEKEYTIEREEEFIVSDGSDYYALLIANQDYDDPEIRDLQNPLADAASLRKILLEKYAFIDQNIVLLENPTREDIIDQFDMLSSKVDDKDNVLIFYAGHGYWDKDSEIGYWLPKNSRKKSKSAWFRNSTLRDYIQEIKSNHTLLIADACFSGGIFQTRTAFSDASIGISRLNAIPSRKAMTSGALSEVPDKSVFMKYLIKRLSDNDEKYLPSESLFSSFRTAVLNNSPNVPQYGTVQNAGDEGGDFIFILKE